MNITDKDVSSRRREIKSRNEDDKNENCKKKRVTILKVRRKTRANKKKMGGKTQAEKLKHVKLIHKACLILTIHYCPSVWEIFL